MPENNDLQYRQTTNLEGVTYENAHTTQDQITRDLGNGQRYTVTNLFEDVASGTTVRVFAQNPSVEDTPIIAGFRQIVSEGTVRGSVYGNVTQDTAGTTIQARNDLLRPDSETPMSTVVEWETGGTYSSLGSGQDLLAPGGTTVGTRGGAVGLQAIARVRPGANLLWELESQSTDNDILFMTVYSEVREE